MPRPDFRVSRAAVAGLGNDAFFWALVEPTWPDTTVTSEKLHLLQASPGQRALYSTILLSRDVSNGGLFQAFWNFDIWFMALAQNSFARIGAADQSRALLKARDLLARAHMQGAEPVRRAYLDALAKRRKKQLAELDHYFYDEERFYPLYHRYIEAHPHEFFVP